MAAGCSEGVMWVFCHQTVHRTSCDNDVPNDETSPDGGVDVSLDGQAGQVTGRTGYTMGHTDLRAISISASRD
ncbi:hypothetical protein ACOMHN_000795 [Nucella lapillus]